MTIESMEATRRVAKRADGDLPSRLEGHRQQGTSEYSADGKNFRAIADLLSSWRRDRRYVDPDGSPRVLPIKGKGASLETLARKFVPEMSVSEVLAAITRHGEATAYRGDKVALVGGSVLLTPKTAEMSVGVVGEPNSAGLQNTVAQRVAARGEQGTWSLRTARLRRAVGARIQRICAGHADPITRSVRSCRIRLRAGTLIKKGASVRPAGLAFLSSATISHFVAARGTRISPPHPSRAPNTRFGCLHPRPCPATAGHRGIGCCPPSAIPEASSVNNFLQSGCIFHSLHICTLFYTE